MALDWNWELWKNKKPNFCLKWWIHYHQHFNCSWKQNSVEYSSIRSFFETTLTKQGNYNWTGKLFSRIWATYIIRNVSLSKHNTRKDKKDDVTWNVALYLLNYKISLNIDRIYVLQTVYVYNSTSMLIFARINFRDPTISCEICKSSSLAKISHLIYFITNNEEWKKKHLEAKHFAVLLCSFPRAKRFGRAFFASFFFFGKKRTWSYKKFRFFRTLCMLYDIVDPTIKWHCFSTQPLHDLSSGGVQALEIYSR